MGVRIDAARHDVTAAGVDDRCAGGRADRRADRDDGLAVDQDVGAPRMIMVHDGTAADDETGHGNSEPAIRKRVTLAVPAARWSLKSRATSPLVASEAGADDEWRADNDGEGARPGQSCSAASSSSGRSAIIMWPAPRRMMVREFGSTAASVLPALAGVIMSRSPRMKVVGTATCAAAASAF